MFLLVFEPLMPHQRLLDEVQRGSDEAGLQDDSDVALIIIMNEGNGEEAEILGETGVEQADAPAINAQRNMPSTRAGAAASTGKTPECHDRESNDDARLQKRAVIAVAPSQSVAIKAVGVAENSGADDCAFREPLHPSQERFAAGVIGDT